jgi:DNA-binding response OmpR family regulator
MLRKQPRWVTLLEQMAKQTRHLKETQSQDVTSRIWVLDECEIDTQHIEKSLGLEYELSFFSQIDQLRQALIRKGERQSSLLPSLVLAEIQFPDGNLLDFLRNPIPMLPPVMVVSSSQKFQTIKSCLELGAHDYFLKPVHGCLLKAKITHFFENACVPLPGKNVGLFLDPFGLQVKNRAGTNAVLTVKQFQILSLLCRAHPHGIDRDVIQEAIWKKISVGSKTFDVHLFSLRRKLESLGYEVRFDTLTSYKLIKKDGATV